MNPPPPQLAMANGAVLGLWLTSYGSNVNAQPQEDHDAGEIVERGREMNK